MIKTNVKRAKNITCIYKDNMVQMYMSFGSEVVITKFHKRKESCPKGQAG